MIDLDQEEQPQVLREASVLVPKEVAVEAESRTEEEEQLNGFDVFEQTKEIVDEDTKEMEASKDDISMKRKEEVSQLELTLAKERKSVIEIVKKWFGKIRKKMRKGICG